MQATKARLKQNTFIEEPFNTKWEDEFIKEPARPAGPTVTIDIRRVSLYGALTYVCEICDYQFYFEGEFVIIVPKGRLFRWFPSVTDRLIAFKPPALFSGKSEFHFYACRKKPPRLSREGFGTSGVSFSLVVENRLRLTSEL